jgi:YVTN family beta-propeller protein
MSVIDGATNTVIDTVAVPPSPLDVAVNPITNRIYVTGFSSQMAVIDGATNTVLSSIEVGPSVPLGVAIMTQGVAVDTVANRIFVANVATDSVVAVDGATNAVLRAISVGLAPQSIALNARGRRVYVTNRDDGTVAILNATRLNLDTILGVQEQPIGIAVHPRTNRLYVANNFTYSISVIEDEIVAVDTTPPTTAATSAPGPNALGWSRGDVTVHLAAIDDAGGSGVREIRFVATGAQTVASTTVPGASADVVIATEGVTAVSFFAVDNAGNTEAQRSVIVRIDRTAPTTVAAVVPAPNVLGWSRDDVAVHFAASDNAGGSGVREIHFTATGAQTVAATTAAGASTDVTISAEGATTVSYFAVDDAGNAEAQRSLVVRIDRTAPTVAFTGNAGTYAIDQQIAITCAAADTLSGLATNTCANVSGRAYTFPVGSTTLSAAATDNAGNAAQATTSFTVVVTASGVCNLTSEFVRSSPNYAELPQRAGADAIAAALCGQLDHIVASLTPEQKAGLLTAYGQGVDALARLGWLTESQSTLLTTLARML